MGTRRQPLDSWRLSVRLVFPSAHLQDLPWLNCGNQETASGQLKVVSNAAPFGNPLSIYVLEYDRQAVWVSVQFLDIDVDKIV
jgi:hypothetical protein